ncbi:hypothetical protein HNR74_000917 [Flammeovirga kamogawensis]|nr:hypothetical protein [Flammeovirga kamogawensis]
MQGEGLIFKILFIVTLSAVFPMVGYYLDYRHKRKMYHLTKRHLKDLEKADKK